MKSMIRKYGEGIPQEEIILAVMFIEQKNHRYLNVKMCFGYNYNRIIYNKTT